MPPFGYKGCRGTNYNNLNDRHHPYGKPSTTNTAFQHSSTESLAPGPNIFSPF